MIKKESIYDFLNILNEKHLFEIMKRQKFSYNKGKMAFSRKRGSFKQSILFNMHYCYFRFNKENETFYLLALLWGSIENPSFQKWLNTNFGEGTFFQHNVYSRYLKHEIAEEDLKLFDTYFPSKAQQFKSFVSQSMGSGLEEITDLTSFDNLKNSEIFSIIENLEKVSDIDSIANIVQMHHQVGLNSPRMLIFLNKQQEAKEMYGNLLEFYKKEMKKVNTDSKKERYRFRHNQVVDEVKKHLDISFDKV